MAIFAISSWTQDTRRVLRTPGLAERPMSGEQRDRRPHPAATPSRSTVNPLISGADGLPTPVFFSTL